MTARRVFRDELFPVSRFRFRVSDCQRETRVIREIPGNKQTSERKNMNNQFDELTKQMAQSITRRAALKKFGVGLAGMALACFGLANKAEANPSAIPSWCDQSVNACCCKACKTFLPTTDRNYFA